MPVSEATNFLQLAGLDLHGNLVTNTSFPARAMVNAPWEPPEGRMVFNEIMFSAAVPGGEYVEFYNRSTNTTFDLSGWRVNGLDYTFPQGSYFAPRTYLVLARNRSVFASAYGGPGVLFDQFEGNLQRDGEPLKLLRPGPNPGEELVVDKVRYEDALPWPSAAADGTGSSCQLVDSSQDNSRAGNWTARYVLAVYAGGTNIPGSTNVGWRLVSLTGSIGSGVGSGQQRLLIYLGETNGASAIIDDLWLVDGTNAATGYNYIRNGDFETLPLLDDRPLTNSWVIGTTSTNTAIICHLAHAGGGGPFSSGGKITADPQAGAANWVFFAVSYDSSVNGGEVRYYFGTPDQAAQLDVAAAYARGPIVTSGKLTVGNFSTVDTGARTALGPNGPSRVFRGLIDELQVFDDALSLAEIRQFQIATPAAPTLAIERDGPELVIFVGFARALPAPVSGGCSPGRVAGRDHRSRGHRHAVDGAGAVH